MRSADATMSSAGNQPNPDLCESLPYGLVSLWDMINFNLVELMQALWMLDFYQRSNVLPAAVPSRPANQQTGILSLANLANPYQPAEANDISEIDRDNGRKVIEAVAKIAKDLDLKTTKHRLFHFELALRYAMTEPNYKSEIKVLEEALKHDLSERHFYHYPPARFEVLLKFYPQWSGIMKAFPLVKSEALAATDCYALQHNTASVFHIMRVAEYGLRALARERKIGLPKKKPVDWATWQEVISQLTKEANKIGEKASAGAAKDNALSFYSGAISDLNAFKDEYRNQVMHLRKEYDEHQALRALVKVHAFMERLSEKVNHKSERIRWGLRFRQPA